MFAAFGLFTAGAVVSINHGISELRRPGAGHRLPDRYAVLGVSFVLEGISFTQAFRQTRHKAGRCRRRHLAYVLNTSEPTLRAVFFEDAAALVGLLIAFTGSRLHQVTGSPVPDALGSILRRGAAGRGRRGADQPQPSLPGRSAGAAARSATPSGPLLSQPDIERVTYLHLEFVGPERIFLVAAVDLTGDEAEHDVAVRLRRLERGLEERAGIEEAVLTLATTEEPSLDPDHGSPASRLF